ncbi:hypothetical protein PO124_12760 [Bacillus licheniformis]|nr:hypothetical protein [Bacillus licheniformis]
MSAWRGMRRAAEQTLRNMSCHLKPVDICKETSAEIGGLKPGTAYSFTVSAKDADGKLHAGPTVEVTTNSDQACSYDEWKETSAYTGGERVAFNGKCMKRMVDERRPA